ncbi:MAG: Type 1 glutamine amidotransferase-like domain-containing protein [Solirubrobacteraceae bacterium]
MVGERTARIVAIGGGGFGSGARDRALDAYVAELAGPGNPRICLLPTASGDPHEQINRFDAAFGRLGCRTSHLSLFRLGDRPVAVRQHLLEQDAIYVGGGSLLNLIAIWRAHGLDRILEEAWRSGILLCGVSAGSMCWFEAGITRSHGKPRASGGLGFLTGSNCVHYDADPPRRPSFHDNIRRRGIPAGFGVDDGAALVFAEGELAEVVTARPAAGACRVELVEHRLVETRLEARLLVPPERDRGDDDPALGELQDLRSAGRPSLGLRR